MLNHLITESKDGNQDSTEAILVTFTPVIKKYSFLLHEEDAESELQLFLLELIAKIPVTLLENNNDGKIVNYITRSIGNHYNHLVSQIIKEKNTLPLSSFSEERQHNILNSLYRFDESDFALIETLKKELTPNEYDIIVLRYFEQYTIQEIADIKGISRQAVNQMHNRAIKRLQKVFK